MSHTFKTETISNGAKTLHYHTSKSSICNTQKMVSCFVGNVDCIGCNLCYTGYSFSVSAIAVYIRGGAYSRTGDSALLDLEIIRISHFLDRLWLEITCLPFLNVIRVYGCLIRNFVFLS